MSRLPETLQYAVEASDAISAVNTWVADEQKKADLIVAASKNEAADAADKVGSEIAALDEKLRAKQDEVARLIAGLD